ncbi:ATP-dependent sacrificial sulfur transferase LarE [Schlesneria paludicola]|uniref:ATP-dependent sacrificial sulfur transferase LarE n=1 Tax=Schlesneria paludicola TaxID=360056 RepID=UPI00029A6D97|nr:ATP-dependent sacrificial sulfur transferase LarE [Schlesneria paludicola]
MPSAHRDIERKRDHLLQILAGYGRVAVAYSAGVDSTVVAMAAQLACGVDAVAVTAVSLSLATGEIEEAKTLAERIGIRHVVLSTQEFADPNYLKNPVNRCYFCKSELYARLIELAPTLGVDVLVNGANLDDRGDYRPGMKAANEFEVRSPLIEAEFTKDDVRELARIWDLPVWDKPATPCLSSRIAYGIEVTPERVRRIDQAELFLKQLTNLRELRVRCEANELARIEVPQEAITLLVTPAIRQQIQTELRRLGFRFITLDLEGFRSGSMNTALPVDTLLQVQLPLPQLEKSHG